MPYIEEKRRIELSSGKDIPRNAGELNFLITLQIKYYLYGNGESYQTYNDIIGALEGCKLELYRRKIAPYEDTKIVMNGDVY